LGVDNHAALVGHSPATRGRGPWNLVYKESFESLLEAQQRELESLFFMRDAVAHREPVA
jgi:predicted GIY-YIG superfamily endonuclease